MLSESATNKALPEITFILIPSTCHACHFFIKNFVIKQNGSDNIDNFVI